MNHFLKQKEFVNYIPITRNIYGQREIHKSKQIKNAVETQKSEYIEIPNLNDLKFRPIITSPFCPTKRLSKLIKQNKIKRYIRDNEDFLNSIPEKLIPTHT